MVWSSVGPHSLIATRSGTPLTYPNCTNRDTLWDGSGPPPVISGAAVLCGTTTGTYSIPALDTAFTYSWSSSNGSIVSGQGTANVTVNWAGSGILTLTRTSVGCGWTDAVTKNVTISASAAPTPALPPTATTCTGQSVVLYPGAFTTYRWSNLYTTSAIAPTTGGTYTVTVTNAAGCQASASTVVTISGAAPVPNLGPNQSVCAGTPLTLNPGTFTSYIWSTGATTQTISPTVAGTYSVTVTNALGCTASASKTVTFTPNPAPSLGPNQTVCGGNTIVLNPGSYTSYLWSTGAMTQMIIPTTSGTYTVTVTNASGCTGSATMNLTVNPAPAPNLGPNQTVCSGNTIILNPGTFSSYIWSTGATTPTISATVAGTYSVTVTGANGCTGNDAITVAFSNPSPGIIPTGPFCTGSPATLDAGAWASYLWSTGATTQTSSPTVTGTYSVTVTDANGCTGTDSIALLFNAAPMPSLGPNQTVCAGTAVTLNPGTFGSYLWSTGATPQTISPTVTGTYSVTVTDAIGCTGRDSVDLTFNPNPSFSLGNDTLICADTTLILDGPVGTYTYIWSTGGLGASITISAGGTYQLSITDASGCTASDTIVITGMTDCVFPGDANYDGVANNQDVLSIGAYYGTTGPVRPGASTQWYGQSLADWGGALPLQADPKHSDCDGDGIVQAVDTLAVTLNYAQTHNKASGTATGASLTVIPLNDSVSPGDTAWFAIHLGEAALLADSVYGLAFTVNHSTSGVLAPGLIMVDYGNCWFAPNGQRLDFTQNMAPAPSVDMAISRIDQQNQQGFGEVGRVAILTDPSPTGTQMPLEVWITGANLVDAGLLPQAVLPVAGTTVISTTLTGISVPVIQPRIYPNPADGWIQIELPEGQLERVEVYDALGKLQFSVDGEGLGSLRLQTGAWSAGMYLLRVHTSAGVYARMQAVRR